MRRRAACRAWAAVVVLACVAAPARAEGEISVTPDQRVTLVGEYPSLEAVLEDLSWRAGFELRSFGIEDREVVMTMREVPLDDALRRLVGRDLYTVGLKVSEDGASRIQWVEVPGPNEPMGARRGRAKARSSDEAPFQVPPKLFLAAFESADPAERSEALATITARVLGDPAERARFLKTDDQRFVEAVEKYPEAKEVLRGLAWEQADSEIRAKLDAVVAAIETSRRSKKPARQAPAAR